jgi:hypothetical protein
MLLTEKQALAHLRIDAEDEPNLSLYMSAAEQAARDYTCRTFYASDIELDEAVKQGIAGQYPLVVTDAIIAAMLLILGHLYMNREDVVIGVVPMELPMNSRYLLAPYRAGMGA